MSGTDSILAGVLAGWILWILFMMRGIWWRR